MIQNENEAVEAVTQESDAAHDTTPASVPTQGDTRHSDAEHTDTEHGDAGHADAGHGDAEHGGSDHASHGNDHHGDHDYLDQGHLMGHVQDSPYFEFSGWLSGKKGDVVHLNLPQPLKLDTPIVGREQSTILPWDFEFTKFMAIEVLVALALIVVFVPLARRIQTGDRPRGRLWNLLEAILLYVRDDVARPSIGKHDADKFMPYLWTVFFFVLFCNLFGLIPFLGSPTGALGVTGVMAIATFAVVLGTGIKKMGFVGFFKAQVPHMELPLAIALFVKPMIFGIEVIGLFVKHFVLAIRLFANMFAGHLVLAVLIAFVAVSWETWLFYLIAPASFGAAVAVNLLEIFVAFLQAYIFTFLSALFIGAAAHPH